MINQIVKEVTDRIIIRSKKSRETYLSQAKAQFDVEVKRSGLHCGNLAHAFAGCGSHDKSALAENKVPNLGIVTAYNDMLSAHKTYENYPDMIRKYANKYNAVAQVAGGHAPSY